MTVRSTLFLSALAFIVMMPVNAFVVAAKGAGTGICETSPFSGSWVSNDLTVPFLSKLDITDSCKQVVLKPVAIDNPWAGDLGIQTKSIYRTFLLRPSSTCSPFDCVWGRSRGRLGKKGQLKARFAMFLSQRIIELTRKDGNLLVEWSIKFRGKRKPDQFGKTVMVRAN